MAEGARVNSLEALTNFKAVLWKFHEAAIVALGDAEAEMHRTLMWLETEQDAHWQRQVRKCQETIVRCKEAVRMKKLFKDSSGRQQSAVDEEKALQIAVRRLAEAEQKLAAVKRWSRALQKETERYKGSVQRFATTVQSEIPAAAAHLENLAAKLDAYVSLQAGGAGAAGAVSQAPATSGGQASMARGSAGGVPITELILSVPAIPAAQLSALTAIAGDRAAPAGDARIAFDPGAANAARIVLRRSAPASPEHTGWLIAPDQPAESSCPQTIRTSDLLQSRPDLRDLLALPVGFSVIIGEAGIVALYDADRQVSDGRL